MTLGKSPAFGDFRQTRQGHLSVEAEPHSKHVLVESSVILIGYFPVKQAVQKSLEGWGMALNMPSRLKYARESAPMNRQIWSTVLEHAISSPLLEKSIP